MTIDCLLTEVPTTLIQRQGLQETSLECRYPYEMIIGDDLTALYHRNNILIYSKVPRESVLNIQYLTVKKNIPANYFI